MKYKYQEQISRLIAEGCVLPGLRQPGGMAAFRFVFSGSHPFNHKPVCIQNPGRRLPGSLKLSGYALSCFDSRSHAERRYEALCKSFKNAPKVIGDTLCGGTLRDEDGMVTEVEADTGHFDLYESEVCDLNKTLKTIVRLWKK